MKMKRYCILVLLLLKTFLCMAKSDVDIMSRLVDMGFENVRVGVEDNVAVSYTHLRAHET